MITMASDKGRKVISEDLLTLVKKDLQWETRQLVNVHKLKDLLSSSDLERKAGAVGKLISALESDEQTLENAHRAVVQVLQDWKGDLGQMNFGSPQIRERFAGLLQQCSQEEETIKPQFDTATKLCRKLIDELKGKTMADIKGLSHDSIMEHVTGLEQALTSWNAHAKNSVEFVERIDPLVKEFRHGVRVLENYFNVPFKLDDLLKGKGEYAKYKNIRDRYLILCRYIRANITKFSAEQKKRLTEVSLKFHKEFKYPTGEKWLMVEQVEPRKTDVMHYDQAIKSLKGRGYDRHLYPWEMFAIMFDSMENPLSPYTELGKDMLQGIGEWTSLSFMKQETKLSIRENVTNLKWDKTKNDYILDGNIDGKSLDIYPDFPQKTSDWVKGSSLPAAFVQKMWGKTPEELAKYNAGTWILTDDVWRPVGRGGYYGFDLLSYCSYRGASRGVRPRA